MAFLTGIVEGFYGRPWSWEDRLDTASFLLATGLTSYLYCPKSDAFLRKQWQRDWPRGEWEQLQKFSRRYRDAGLNWGVGLSPYALYRDYTAANRDLLRDKVRRLNGLGGNMLAILFDDMPGDCADLARIQGDIASDVREWSSAEEFLVCPTYYSTDPVLERFFGAMPEGYWRDFGQAAPAEAHILWTGPEVCSRQVDAAHLEQVSGWLGRKPCLWDNYPVNDGEKASQFIHMQPLPGREAGLEAQLSGHFCNPMNQARLSRYPLQGLARLYGEPGLELDELYDPGLCELLLRDMERFQGAGLAQIAEAERLDLAVEYGLVQDPAAAEVAAWLRGEFAFDPACLTG